MAVKIKTDRKRGRERERKRVRSQLRICSRVSSYGKESWPELVGMDGQVAPPIIKAQNPYVTDVPIVKEGTIVILNFLCNRVRVWVKPNGTIYQPPTIG
ncbi:Wound-induced proteinase inhibitor 1 [Nymphaea thermarum]|nr:Wound-induced proteinase inhibitor 1 [Nymphaea thermarum]